MVAEVPNVAQLRDTLAQLRYTQPLSEDSAPLVSALLTDLVAKDRELKQQAEEVLAMSQQHEPLKRDNTRLLRENNELHLELIRRAEEAEARERRFEGDKRALERENTNLRFVGSQQAERLQTLERSNETLRTRAEAALQQAQLILPPGAQIKKRASHGGRCVRRDARAPPARRATHSTVACAAASTGLVSGRAQGGSGGRCARRRVRRPRPPRRRPCASVRARALTASPSPRTGRAPRRAAQP